MSRRNTAQRVSALILAESETGSEGEEEYEDSVEQILTTAVNLKMSLTRSIHQREEL